LSNFADALRAEALLPPPTPFVRLLIPLIEQIQDFEEFARLQILVLLQKLIGTYLDDDELHHAVGNAIAQVLDHTESPAVLDQFDLTLFFRLFESKVPEVIQSASIGLATALEKSDRIVRALVGMGRPAGVAGLCTAVRRGSIASRVAIMNCLGRLAEKPLGVEAIHRFLGEIVSLLGLPIGDTGVWSQGHSFLLSGLLVLQNATLRDRDAVAAALTDQLAPLLCQSVIDYTIDLVRMLHNCPHGRTLLNALMQLRK
jgi:hypothetical protein